MAPAAATRRAAPHRRPNLDLRSLLPNQINDGQPPPISGPWQVTYYPTAKEACVTPLVYRDADAPRRAGNIPGAVDAAAAAENERRNVRRARGTARRYCRSNQLRYLWVLTYRGAGCHEWPAMVAHVRRFCEAMAPLRVPLMLVPEWHPGGHGLHVNLALGTWVDWRTIQAAWPHGSTKAPKLRGGNTNGRRRMDASTLASYVAGYVTRGASAGSGELGKPGAVTGATRPPGAHRYFVAQCHQPPCYQEATATLSDMAAFLRRVMGRPASYTWRSWDAPDADANPWLIACWCDYWPRPPKGKRK